MAIPFFVRHFIYRRAIGPKSGSSLRARLSYKQMMMTTTGAGRFERRPLRRQAAGSRNEVQEASLIPSLHFITETIASGALARARPPRACSVALRFQGARARSHNLRGGPRPLASRAKAGLAP